MTPTQDTERARWRRGGLGEEDGPLYPLEQEYSLSVPFDFSPESGPAPGIAVLLHVFHLNLLSEFRAYLSFIPYPADIYVSTDDAAKAAVIATKFADWTTGTVQVRVVPNRGRDVAPKLVGFADIHDRYAFVLHLHTKRSAHDSRLVGWRGYLLESLLGSAETVRCVFEAFRVSPQLGLLAPQHIDELRPWIRWGDNFHAAEALAERMHIPLPRRAPLDFPSGSMFWARSAALRPLLDLRLGFDDFPEEEGQTDGTLAHAIERLYFLVCEQAGFDWMKLSARGQLHARDGVLAISSPLSLQRAIARHRLRLFALRDERRAIEDAPFITTPPPMPRRVSHVLWRAALGEGVLLHDARLRVVMDGDADMRAALSRLPPAICVDVVRLPSGDGSWCESLRAGFHAGADVVLLLEGAGVMHPEGLVALMRMHQAQGGRAVLEGAAFPRLAPRPVDTEDFSTGWADGPALAVPRAVFEATGGLDAPLDGADALRDCAARAREAGFAVRHCPGLLYLGKDDRAAAPDAAEIGVIVRLYDTSELPLLGRCVFALTGQAVRLRVHVMVQRFTFAEMRDARAAVEAVRPPESSLHVTLHNWEYPEPFDLRIPLLNWGLELARSRYCAVLELGDVPQPSAFADLLARLRATDAAMAVGRLVPQRVRWWGDVVLPLGDAAPDGVLPRLALLDRERATPQDTVFRAGAPGGPDRAVADWIARLAPDADPPHEPLGVRQVPG